MASASKDQSQKANAGDKKSKKKNASPVFSFSTKDSGDRKSWFSFPGFLPKMHGRGKFNVSPIDKRNQMPPKNLTAQFQQKLLAAMNFDDDRNDRKVVLGICAMAKKSKSKPMNEIIRRLVDNFERLQVIVFDEDTILNKPVEEWPIVNGFVSFFSHGFPLEKAIAYKNLRNPFIVNDLEMQYTLQSRPRVYAMMRENNIPHPRYAVLDRDNDPDCNVVETEDSIEVNSCLFMKPFVEKPLDAEDHNIYIYFPVQAGGGSTRLFRKVKDRSSVYSRFCRVRKEGSYLYEDFMPTDGTDVKVYTVGPDYQHAEARKSPALDGKVERNSDGKEIRYPVLLTSREKMIARTICKVFKQNVCGFDLLRASGRHYVCDINGFSFVKTSGKYYDDCAKILGTLVMRACCPQLHIPYPMCTAPEDIPVVQTTSGFMMELRCVIAVIRHGDRTPKQKLKMEVKNRKFFDLFEKHGGYKKGHLKLKKPKQLQEVLDIARDLLSRDGSKDDPEIQENKAKLNQLKMVLEMYGHFSGINRKVQLKYQPTGRPKKSSSEEDVNSCSSPGGPPSFYQIDESPRDPSLLLILKWGGELTPAGRAQAENLGKAFRTLYPGGQGQFEAPGLGFLRLHSTFRHDLKIYASDEGRVQMTAAAFTKGMLALEGELTPIVVQMVKSANTNGLLDGESNTSKCQNVVKEKLKEMFNQDREFTEEDYQKLATTNSISLINAMQFVKNPFQMCSRVHEMIKEFTARIRCLKSELKSRDLTLFSGESWELLIRRWAKLEKDFHLKNGRFDISKIPDIYDCIKYDLHYNQKTLQFKRAHELFMCSKALADIIIPQEYGITKEERLHIGQSYCTPLLHKIRCDLLQCISTTVDESTTRLDYKYSNGVASPERFVRTRLYFTSESHVHSLLSVLRYGGLLDEEKDEQWKQSMDFLGACAELNYMSQVVLMMFEDPAQSIDSDERFHIELHFSPGAYTSCDEMAAEPKGMGYRPKQNRETETTTPTNIPELLEESPTACKNPKKAPPLLTQSVSLPDNIQEELFEEDMFCQLQQLATKEEQPRTIVKEKPTQRHRRRSPDPNTPEWDWGDEVKTTNSIQTKEQKGRKDVPKMRFDISTIKEEVRLSADLEDKTEGSKVNSKRALKGEVGQSSKASELEAAKLTSTARAEKTCPVSAEKTSPANAEKTSTANAEKTSTANAEKTSTANAEKTSTASTGKTSPVNAEKTSTANAEKTSPSNAEKISSASAEKTSTASAEKTSTASAEKTSTASAEKTSTANAKNTSTASAEKTSTANAEKTSSASAEKTSTASAEKTSTANAEKTSTASAGKTSLASAQKTLLKQDSECSPLEEKGKRTRSELAADKEVESLCRSPYQRTEPILIKGSHSEDSVKSMGDDKRSKSLEDTDGADKMEIDGLLKPTYTQLKQQMLHERRDVYERNYRTIHLPLSNEMTTMPLSSFFFYNQAPRALEGFSNVPLLHPLETLHNNLTFHQVDDFLGRSTWARFGLPATIDGASTSCKSKLSLSLLGKGFELPSSSNSSGGPSSPVFLSGPVDLMKTLGMYIGKQVSQDGEADLGLISKEDITKDTGVSHSADDEVRDVDVVSTSSTNMAPLCTKDVVSTSSTNMAPLCTKDVVSTSSYMAPLCTKDVVSTSSYMAPLCTKDVVSTSSYMAPLCTKDVVSTSSYMAPLCTKDVVSTSSYMAPLCTKDVVSTSSYMAPLCTKDVVSTSSYMAPLCAKDVVSTSSYMAPLCTNSCDMFTAQDSLEECQAEITGLI